MIVVEAAREKGGRVMQDWNVVISLQERAFTRAFQLLGPLGVVSRTDFFNVLVMRVDDVRQFLEALRQRFVEDPEVRTILARVVPVTQTFSFQNVEEFEQQAQEVALRFVPALAGKSFHVRMHRRGFKGRLSSKEEEKRLAEALLEALEKAGTPGRIRFEEPEAILVVETVGGQAGMALWTQEDLRRYPFLRLD